MDTISRYNTSTEAQRQQKRRKRKNTDTESPWDRDPNRDNELRLGLDIFKRRFGCDKMEDVVNAINEADIGCKIDANWIYLALQGKKYKDT